MTTKANKLARMFRQSPDYYRESLVMAQIWGTIAEELAARETDNDEIMLQLNVQTATWGLDIYEKTLDIPTDLSKPYQQRRERILSKMRGPGLVNLAKIKEVAESYYGGEVELTNSPTTYQFTLKFVSSYGIPENVEDLQAAIDDIKPAHLEVLYAYSYILIKDIHEVLTLTEMEALKLNQFAG